MPWLESAMRDWRTLVERELAGLRLRPDAKQEVIAELASHLDECEIAGAQALGEQDELRSRQLARAIQRAKGDDAMNRTKSLWIPVFVNLLLSSVLINICNWLGWIDVRITQPGPVSQALQPWLLTLPICGATAAFLARCNQGSPAIRVLAALSPSFAWLASIPAVNLIFICFPNVFAAMPPLRALASAAVGWFVFPAFALFVGAVPFLVSPRPQVIAE
jgi:hypothetical protein